MVQFLSSGWIARTLHVLLGGLLVFAGGGKLLALLRPVDTLGWPSWLIVLGGVVEVILGLWLLSGLNRRAAHVATLGIFAIFCALSTVQVIRGVPSCGCLAKIHVHPAWMLTFDLVVTATLATLLPLMLGRRPVVGRETPAVRRQPVTPLVFAAAGGTAASLAVVGVLVAMTGVWRPVVGLAAPAVTLRPAVIDIGPLIPGESRVVEATLVNETTSPVRLVGGKNNCACLVTAGLPATIPPRGDVTIPLTLTPSGEGPRAVTFVIFTDQPEQSAVAGTLRYIAAPVSAKAQSTESERSVAAAADGDEDVSFTEDGK